MQADFKIGFIGAGNMSGAIARGLIAADVFPAAQMFVSDLDSAKLESFDALGIRTGSNNQEVIDWADVIILAIKPNVFEAAIPALKNIAGKLFISLAAGISVAYIKRLLGDNGAKVIRTMPNTPLLVGAGMTALCYEAPVTEQDYEKAALVFHALGKSVLIPESQMNHVVALNGSAPAYFFMLMDAMIKTGKEYGFSEDVARTLVAQTVLGSAHMVLETDTPVEILKKNVCSPGGTTIEAVHVLEDAKLEDIMKRAMDACTKRAFELSRE